MYDFEAAKQTMLEQLLRSNGSCFLLKWIPSPSNVDFLLYVLKKFEFYNSVYAFEMAFPEP